MLLCLYMTYSQEKFQISKRDILQLVKQSKTAGLNAEEERIIEETILRVRGSDERVSLFQINKALRILEREGTISKFDRKFVMDAMEAYAAN